jgi:hypothetical protein
MRRLFLTIFALAMTAMTLLSPSLTSAAELGEGVILDETQRSARADFEFKRGCIQTRIGVNTSTHHQDWIDGSTYDSSVGGVSVDQYNTCTEAPVLGVDFYSDEMQVEVGQKFNGALLRGEVLANNYVNDGGDVLVKINLVWVPAGRIDSRSQSSEIVATLPGGEQVPAIMDATDYDRRSIAMGTITVGNQFFPLFDREDDTVIYGFDGTWTAIN